MKKFLTFSFLTAAALGFLKILSIVPFDRMSADDFVFTKMAVIQGFWKSQTNWYFDLTGRFVRNFLLIIFGMISGANGKVIVFFVVSFILLFAFFVLFFKNLIKAKVNYFYIVILSGASLVTYYLITPNKNESWYWLSGSLTYLWPTIFGLGAIALLLSEKKSLANYFFLFILAFLAGPNEILGLLFTGVLGIFLLTSFIKNGFKSPKTVRFLVAFAGSIISFLIMFVAPGNYVRIAGPGADEMSIGGTFLYSIQKGPQLLYSIVSENALYLISFFGSLAFLFSAFNPDTTGDRPEKSLSKIFYILSAPIFLSILFMIPGYRSLGRVPPDRTDVTLSFIVLLGIIFAAYELAKLFIITKIDRHFLFKIFGLVFAFIFLIASFRFTSTFAEDIYIAKNYSDAFDALFLKLKNISAGNRNQVIIISPLPESGLVHSETLLPDPNHFGNLPFAYFFDLKAVATEAVKNNAK